MIFYLQDTCAPAFPAGKHGYSCSEGDEKQASIWGGYPVTWGSYAAEGAAVEGQVVFHLGGGFARYH